MTARYIRYRKFSLLSAIKLVESVFIIYMIWFADAFGTNKAILYGSFVISTILVLMDNVIYRTSIKDGYYSVVPLLASYGIYFIITSPIALFLSGGSISSFISSCVTYVSYFAMSFYICYTSARVGEIDWLRKRLFFCALLCAFQTVFLGQYVRSGRYMVITMGQYNNPNSLGLAMVIGIFSVIVVKDYKKLFFRNMAFIALFLYVIILSGSRKCLISAIILVLLKEGFTTRGLCQLIFCLLFFAIGIYIARNYFSLTTIFERFSTDNMNSGLNDRTLLYKRAFELWLKSPIIGIAYDQFKVLSGYNMYSHSTFAEILACTGVLGIAIWAYYIARLLFSLRLKHINCKDRSFSTYHYVILNLMFLIELFLGLGQIWFYDMPHLLVLIFVFGYSRFIQGNINNLSL